MPGIDREFLVGFHAGRPGITEDLLGTARGPAGESPYQWLAAAIPGAAGGSAGVAVVDVACGSAPLRPLLGPRYRLGVDLSAAELSRARAAGAPVAQGDALGLPLADGSVDTVTCSMALMLISPPEPALREIARVLRPGGVLAALVPASRPVSGGDLRLLAGLLLRLRSTISYPEPLPASSLSFRLAACGLELRDDAAQRFALPLTTPVDAELLVRSLYLPGVPAAQVESAARWLAGRLPADFGIPLRRLVAGRP